MTSKESFKAIRAQIENFIESSPIKIAQNIVLVGNKLDLASEYREVSLADAETLARELGLAGVLETSAKESNDTLDDAFFITIANAMDTIESDKYEALGLNRSQVQIEGRPSNALNRSREERGFSSS